ncbi:hypothetical protein CH380_07745 [Leptospira adleri]|uniref:Uncharacterized protein n=1 Tax=Leptospira adleri TaxID=2023186 RepID=A0A2M9YQT1_9LEPT|nr:hypothetical protein CH380_07745 [Leptospira adleri]PJZ63096.1 hypothetical protein CH376_04385 [Leptospira adleri]
MQNKFFLIREICPGFPADLPPPPKTQRGALYGSRPRAGCATFTGDLSELRRISHENQVALFSCSTGEILLLNFNFLLRKITSVLKNFHLT